MSWIGVSVVLNLKPAVSLLLMPLAACSAFAETPTAAKRDPVSSCVKRGITYLDSIGSYPKLKEPPNTGRAAEEVALERCLKSLTAF